MELRTVIKKRKSVRRFSEAKPNWRKIIEAIDLARFAPSAGNIFNLRFILVSDKEKIEKLAEASQQSFVKTARFVVVAFSDKVKLTRSYGERGERYSSLQAGASIQNFLLALTEIGLVTTWVGYFYDEKVKEILSIPDEMIVEGIFPIGKETKIKTPEKIKAELESILYYGAYGVAHKLMLPETIATDVA